MKVDVYSLLLPHFPGKPLVTLSSKQVHELIIIFPSIKHNKPCSIKQSIHHITLKNVISPKEK